MPAALSFRRALLDPCSATRNSISFALEASAVSRPCKTMLRLWPRGGKREGRACQDQAATSCDLFRQIYNVSATEILCEPPEGQGKRTPTQAAVPSSCRALARAALSPFRPSKPKPGDQAKQTLLRRIRRRTLAQPLRAVQSTPRGTSPPEGQKAPRPISVKPHSAEGGAAHVAIPHGPPSRLRNGKRTRAQ